MEELDDDEFDDEDFDDDVSWTRFCFFRVVKADLVAPACQQEDDEQELRQAHAGGQQDAQECKQQ